jgi:ATP-binding cassette, subfamily C (CFTR/MRP), member 1
MPATQPAPALTATEVHREQNQEDESIAVAAQLGAEKHVISKVGLSSSASEGDFDQDASPSATERAKRTWRQKLNPLRLQKIPPVPQERIVSREYGANFFSAISFQWVFPLMNVSIFINVYGYSTDIR